MALLKKILGLVFNRLVLTLVGLVAIAVLIWVVGEKVAIGEVRPLDTERSRLVAIGVVVALVLLRAAWQAWRARSMNTAVVRQLIKAPTQPAARAEPGEPEQLRARFEAAAKTLREARFGGGRGFWDGLAARAGRRYLYELPWYAIIGEPGAGKTTALRHSGLRFPLAQALGADGTRGVTGVAGTRNIDWWFTDRAVLIDTAGRYVSQDSDPEADRTAWSAFLELLKRYRPSRPLNGVLVTLSVQDLLESSAAERSAQAIRLRERIQELHARLGMRFPIYLLVTKCDLLAGFMETLGQADREQRAAPWGFTFPLDTEQRSDPSGLVREFDALTQRLVDGLVDRLQAERDPTRRAQIYSFPQQFATLRDLLHGFTDTVFSPSPYEAHPLLRGVYFVSGTQEGTPLDRVIGTLTRSHGLANASLPAQHGTGKSFFIERLLGEVIFAESELGGTNLKWERRRAALAAGGYAGLAVVAVALIALWAMSWVNNRAWVDSIDARIERAERELKAAHKSAPGDVAALLPGLEAVRDLVIADPRARRSWILGLGLSQGGKLDAAAGQAYRQLLSTALLPRLVARVEDDLRNSRDKPDFEYDALRIYLMLHDSRNFKPEQVRDWFAEPRRSGLGADASTAARKEMASHMATLFERGPMLSPLPRDDELVKRLRSTLAAVPLPRRVYERMLREGVGRDIPEFTPAKAGGAAMPLVFERASSAPLTQGIPGLYTHAGYHEAFQKQVVAATRRLAEEEPWVIGTADASRTGTRLGDAELQRQADAVRTLYLEDYAARWQRLVTDLRLIRPRTPDEAIRVAEVLTGRSSPLKPLMTGIVRQTTLGSEAQRGAIEQATQQAQSALGKVRTGVGKLIDGKPGTPAALPPGTPVEAIVGVPFAELRRQMTAGDDGKGQAPIDSTLKWLDEKLVELKAAKEAIAERHPPVRPKPLQPEVARLPEPLRGVVESLADASTKANNSASAAVLMDDLRGDVVRFCRAAVAGRYPVAPNGREEIRPTDFATLFGPGGLIDKFFEKNLATLVDTGRLPWSVRRIDGQQAPIDAATLMQFQRAKAIRDAFFPGGAAVPSFKLQITPVAADPSILSLSLDVDGQKLRYAHGPPIPVQIAWPGPQGSTQVRLQFDPPAASGPSALVKQGPWALQRLFDTARLALTDDPARFRATIDIGGRKADFDVIANSVYNPFRLRELTDFACPGGG